MKNLFSILLFLFVVGCDSSDEEEVAGSIENVQFEHPAMKKCLLFWAEENGWTLVEQVTKLSCSKNGIDSLGGIAQLYNLEKLTLIYTALTEIDLGSNPKLKDIQIMWNPYLQKVNLSNNLELTRAFVNFSAVK